MALKYLFTLECNSITSEFAGELPAGSRMHVRYNNGTLSTDKEKYARAWLAQFVDTNTDDGAKEFAATLAEQNPCERAANLEASPKSAFKYLWAGLEGSILRGIDWALVRKDGVVSFDTRLTLCADVKEGGPFLIEALMSGAVDLNPNGPNTDKKGEKTYRAWKTGQLTSKIPLALGVRFEATGAAPADASPEHRAKAENFPRFMRLTRCQCVAIGNLVLEEGTGMTRSPLKGVKLDVFELDVLDVDVS